jgi:hypothetical protein
MFTLEEWISRAWNDLKTSAPKLAIRNEADLKCHLFSRLLTSRTEVVTAHEVHSEIRFPVDQNRNGIIVDIAIAANNRVMAVIELKYSRLPVFEKDLVNLCKLRDEAKVRELSSGVQWVSTPYSRDALKLSDHTLWYFGCACADSARSVDRNDMLERMKNKYGLNCNDIDTLPPIVFSAPE